jgi:hypothetical protein
MESRRGTGRGDATWIWSGVVGGARVGHLVGGGREGSELHGAEGAGKGLWIPLP